MKRHPKHARPLWGSPKRKRPIDWNSLAGISLAFPPGTYVEGDVYRFTAATCDDSTPITFGYAVWPTPPRPGVLTFTTNGATPIEGP